MSQATRVVRLVREQRVPSRGFAHSHARVLMPIEGPPEATGLLLEVIMSRVRSETGTPEKSIRFHHREGSRFEVSGPSDFVDRLTAQAEVDICDEPRPAGSELDR